MPIKDITKTGPQNYKDIQEQNQTFLQEWKQSASPRQRQTGALQERRNEFRNPVEWAQQLQQAGYGESKYDEYTSPYHLEDLENTRGLQQSGWEQIANGILKGVITTGTTYIDLLAGIPVGMLTAAAEGRLSGLWDNVITNAMQSVTDWSEEALPNYYTQEQQESAWYSPVNLFSANFLGDKLIKNFGFSAGAALGMKTFSKIPKLLPKLATNQNIARAINTAETSLAGAVGEGSIEALNNTRDWANNQRTLIEQEKAQSLATLEADYAQRAQAIQSQYGNTEVGASLIRSLVSEYQNEVNKINSLTNRKISELQNQIDTQGNLILAGNIPILWGSNLLTLGKMIGRGYKATQSTIDKYVVKEGGKYVSTLTGAKQAARYAKTPLAEGLEEMNQAVISTAAGNRATDYYEMSIDPDKTESTKNYLGYIWDALGQTYGDINRYEEFVIGMLSSGISDIVLGQGKALKEERQNINDAVQRANTALNTFNTQSLLHYLNRQQVLEDQKTTAAIMNDKKAFKDAELAQVASAVAAFSEIGKIEDLKALIDANINNLTDAELDDLAGELQQQGVEEANFFMVMSYDQRRDYLKKQRDTYHKMIDIYSDARDKIVNISGTVFTPEEVSELTYYRVRADLAADRRKELINTIEKKVTDSFKDKTEDEIKEIATQIHKALHLSSEDIVDTNPQNIAKLLRQTDTTKEENKAFFDKYFPQQDLFTDLKDIDSLEEDVLQYNKTLTDFIQNPSKLKNKRQKSKDKVINQKEQAKAAKEKQEKKDRTRKAKERKVDDSIISEITNNDDLDYNTQRNLSDAYQRKRDEGKTSEEALKEIKDEAESIVMFEPEDGVEYSQEERERLMSQVEKAMSTLERATQMVSDPRINETESEEPDLNEPEPESDNEPTEVKDNEIPEPYEPTTQDEVIKSNVHSELHREPTYGELFRPQLTEYYLHGINEETYLDYINEHLEAIPDGIDADEYKLYIEKVHNYLKKEGAFAYIKQQLKVNDKIIFYTNSKLNEDSKQTVILIGIETNSGIQCIGNLPTEIDFKGKSKYPIYNEDKTEVIGWKVKDKPLSETQSNRYKQYQELKSNIKTAEESDGTKKLGKSKINKLYGGNLSRTDTNHPVSDTFEDTVPLIAVTKELKLQGIGNAKTVTIRPEEGQVYVLIPQNNGIYIPALAYSRKLKEESADSEYIQYLIDEFQKLLTVSEDELVVQQTSINRDLRIPSKTVKSKHVEQKVTFGISTKFIRNGKPTEHRELASHLQIVVANSELAGNKIIYNIPIKDGKLSEKDLHNFISNVANKMNATTGVDLSKLNDTKYRKFISNYLYFNILEPHSVNDYFTYDAPTSKKKQLDKEQTEEEIQKKTPNSTNETFVTKNNEVLSKDGQTGVWVYQNTGELVPDTVLVKNGLKEPPININGTKTTDSNDSSQDNLLDLLNPNNNKQKYVLRKRPKNFTSEITEPIESEKVLYKDIDKLAKIIPSFNVKERVQIVQGLIDSIDKYGNPIQVYSNYIDGVIYISSKTPKGVLYHEMFHYVSDMLLTEEEKKILFEEAVKRYGQFDEMDLEEKLAEDFRRFMNNETDTSLKGRLRRLFEKLRNLINKANKDKSGINTLFWDIYKNKLNSKNNTNDMFKQRYQTYLERKLSYNNLDNDTKQYLEQRKISPKDYESLSATFKQYLLKCM